MPFVINIAAAPQITEQGYKFVFRNFQTAGDIVRNGLDLIGELFQAHQHGSAHRGLHARQRYLRPGDDQGYRRAASGRTQLPFKIVDTICYDPAAKDLSVEVSKAKAANADFLLLVCRLNDAIILRREMVKQRWQPMGIVSPGSPGMLRAAVFKALGKLSDYSISNVPWFNPNQADQGGRAAPSRSRTRRTSSFSTASTPASPSRRILIAADAYKRAKSTDPEDAGRGASARPTSPDNVSSAARSSSTPRDRCQGIGSAVAEPERQPDGRAAVERRQAKPVFPGAVLQGKALNLIARAQSKIYR